MNSTADELVDLCRLLGDPAHRLAMLAEGNASIRTGTDTFRVKASGYSMTDIGPDGFVEARISTLLAALDAKLDDTDVRESLRAALIDPAETRMPSVEAFMHAYLLSLPGVSVVGHCHPDDLLPVLCRPDAALQAGRRYFPDEIVCTGPASPFVPYADPGAPLAVAIRVAVTEHARKSGELPRTIWLGHHGLIAIGDSVRQVSAACQMTAKAARLRWQSGFGATPLPKGVVQRIHSRPDEHYRQRIMNAIAGA